MYNCKDTGESGGSYCQYLRTEHWRIFKEEFGASKSSKKVCYCCSNKYDLRIHHKTYIRVGMEKFSDVIELCDDCHSTVHAMLENNPNRKIINLRNAANKYRTKLNSIRQKKAILECFKKHSKAI